MCRSKRGPKRPGSSAAWSSIHAGSKSNSIEGIQNKEQFQQRIKYDITEHWVDLMEIGQLKDIDVHLKDYLPHDGLG